MKKIYLSVKSRNKIFVKFTSYFRDQITWGGCYFCLFYQPTKVNCFKTSWVLLPSSIPFKTVTTWRQFFLTEELYIFVGFCAKICSTPSRQKCTNLIGQLTRTCKCGPPSLSAEHCIHGYSKCWLMARWIVLSGARN